LAGNFGFEAGHLAVSEACAEDVLLPALRSASKDSVVLADGFSCRTQIAELDSGGRDGIHLAELLNRARGAEPPPQGCDLAPGDRPEQPGVVARGLALGGVVLAAGAAAAGIAGAVRRLVRR
jgi:hypothetical protein